LGGIEQAKVVFTSFAKATLAVLGASNNLIGHALTPNPCQ